MAIIKCPECERDVSDKAKTCPNCGYPIADNIDSLKTETEQPAEADIMFLLDNRPVNMTQLWKANPNKVECVKQIRQIYNADLNVASKMVEDFLQLLKTAEIYNTVKTEKNSVPSGKNNYQNRKKYILGDIIFLIILIILAVIFYMVGLKHAAGGLVFLVIILCLLALQTLTEEDKSHTTPKTQCPRCGSKRFHAFIEEQVIIPEKVKSSTSLNLNPLKPFTVYNHKTKVVRQASTRQVSKFVCDDCGNIFE